MTDAPLYPRLVVIGVAVAAGVTLVIAAACAVTAAALVIGVHP